LRPGEDTRRLGVADAAGEADRRAGHPVQPTRVGAVADDQQRQAQLVEGPHRDLDALVRHQLGEDDVGVARRGRREALDVDGRVQHGRLAPEVAGHAAFGRLRVGDVGVDALGRDPVPLPPALEHRAERRAPERAARGERLLACVPRVAKRVVAIADVHGVLVGDDAVRPRARARDHEVVPAQVQRLHRGGVQRQQGPEGPGAGPQALQVGRLELAVGEAALGALLVVDRGEEVGLREEVAEREKDALCPAHVHEEVVHQGDP
jgi:hypothetical protein